MRVLVLPVLTVALLSCEPADSTTAKKSLPLPPNSVHLDFADRFAALCKDNKCPGATRVLGAGASQAAIVVKGDEVLVGFALRVWQLGSICNVFGCISQWMQVDEPVCYSVKGSTVTPATGCGAPVALLPDPGGWAANDQDPTSMKANLSRALFGVENAKTTLMVGKGVTLEKGGYWWGDVSVRPTSWAEYWGYTTSQQAVDLPMVALIKLNGSSAWPVQSLVTAPDTVPIAGQTFGSERDGEQHVYFADRTDEVFELSASDDQVLGRRVRKSFTAPLTRTVAIAETADTTFSLVLTESSTTLTGLAASTVFEVSLMRSPLLKESAKPLLPFSAMWAHTPDSQSVVACFNEPLKDEALSLDQFKTDNDLKLLSISNSTVPQCARLRTSPMLRNLRYRLTITGVASRSGATIGNAVVSFTPDDVAVGALQIQELRTFNAQGVLPLESGETLLTWGPSYGLLDVQGVTYRTLDTMPVAPAVQGTVVVALPDGVSEAMWVNYTQANNMGFVALQEASGVQTIWSNATVPDGVFNNAGFVRPLGDGSALIMHRTSGLIRLRKGGTAEPVPLLGLNTLLSVEPVSHDVWFVETGRIKRLTLPSTVAAASFAAPAGTVAGSSEVCQTQTTTWLCSLGFLYKLGDAASEKTVTACTHLRPDPDGNCWLDDYAAQPIGLKRVRGDTITPVALKNPLKADGTLYAPEFVGNTVLLNNKTLRLPLSQWRSLTGGL